MEIRIIEHGWSGLDCDCLQAELVDRMEQLIDEPPSEEVLTQLVEVVNHVFSLLPVQFDQKREDGYLQHVTERFPNWHEQVELLQVEQALLYEDLREIRNTLESGSDSEATLTSTAPQIQDWIARLRRHDQEEVRLSQVAMNLDVGGQSG